MAIPDGVRVQFVSQDIATAFLLEPPGWTRLEPQSVSGDPTPGLEARVHDPLWLLARQWQLGEFHGEDAGSPFSVKVTTSTSPVAAFQPGDPSTARPLKSWSEGELLEPVVEAEPAGPRGPGLRQRAEAGAQLLTELREVAATEPLIERILADCPLAAPWKDAFDTAAAPLLATLAGRVPDAERAAVLVAPALAESPPKLPAEWMQGLAHPAQVLAVVRDWHAWYRDSVSPEPAAADDCWIDERLEYRFSLAVDGPGATPPFVLRAPEFSGGHVDWYDLDWDPIADTSTLPPNIPQSTERSATLLAAPLRFAGMPALRYWQFEDGQVNLGALEAQPHDLARVALVEFAMVYGNDWFVVPVDLPYGSHTTVTDVRYTTTFGDEFVVRRASDGAGPGQFRLFELFEVGDNSLPGLLVPPSAPVVLEGQPLEEVLYLRDEMANMAWGVERLVQGPSGDPRSRTDEPRPAPFEPGTDPGAQMDYQLENEVPSWWIPFLPVSTGYATIALRKGAMVHAGAPVLPLGTLLRPGAALVLSDEEVPREGVRVRRVPALARRADGSYVRWVTRRVSVGRGEGASGLAFDSAVRRRPPDGGGGG
jgi:hypothetical protein